MFFRKLIVLGSGALFTCSPAHSATEFIVLERYLGDQAAVTAITPDGSVTAGFVASTEKSVVWNDQGQVQGKGSGRIYDVNSDATVFVGDTGDSGFPAVWKNGNEAVSILNPPEFGQARSVTSNGQISCGYTAAGDLEAKKFNHVLQSGLTVEPAYSIATRITPDGNVIVGELGSGAFRKVGNNPVDVIGSGSINLLDVSDDGEVVVGSGAGNVLFRWTKSGGIKSLGYFHNGGYDNRDASVSGDGRTIVGGGGVGDLDVFVWDETNSLRDVTPLVEKAAGIDLSDWNLDRINAISYDGDVIAGYGFRNASGGEPDSESWLIKGFSKVLYPTIRIEKVESDYLITFSGVLQESDDLGITDPWTDVAGDPTHKYTVKQPLGIKKFFRARSL